MPFNICFWQSWNFQNTPKRHWPISRIFRKYENIFFLFPQVFLTCVRIIYEAWTFWTFWINPCNIKAITVRTLRELSCVPCTQTPVYIKYSCFAAVALAGAYANHRNNNHLLVRHWAFPIGTRRSHKVCKYFLKCHSIKRVSAVFRALDLNLHIWAMWSHCQYIFR